MKNAKRLIAIGLLLMLIPVMAACGKKESAAGYYVLQGATEGGAELDPQVLEDGGFNESYVVLNEDGTGYIMLVSTLTEFKWEKGVIDVAEGEDFVYGLKDGLLTLADGSVEMRFQKTN